MPREIVEKRQISGTQAKLKRLLDKGNVPTLPMVAQKLTELCKDENANFAMFAQVLESDQGLASRILRVANSAYYGLRIKATTLERAITALGLKYVRSISLGFHLATSLSKFATAGFDMDNFWRQSLLRAVMARQLAIGYCPRNSEEAFLTCLLQDCGVPFLAQAFGNKYTGMWSQCQTSAASLFQMEKQLFEFDHVAAFDVIMEKWKLPELLADPIRKHHRRGPVQASSDEHVQLCQIAYFVGTLPLNNPESFSREDLTLADYCNTVFRLDQNGIGKLLEQTRQEFSSVSKLFAGIVPEKIDITELLFQAKDMLSDVNEDANRKIFNCEDEIKNLESKCKELFDSADNYRQQAQKDDLTNLTNRAYLSEFLDDSCKNVSQGQSSLTVMFIDIDNFKVY